MWVKSKDMVFRDGKRLRVDPKTGFTGPYEIELAEGKKLPSHLVEVEGHIPANKEEATEIKQPEGKKLNRKQVMQELAAAGVSFKATVPTEELEALLAEAKAKIAPAASGAPSKEDMKSSGDKDVI